MAEIAVSDRGPGIPQGERERVLDRFVRLEASRSEPGSGLGLSLVAAVARFYGGQVRLEDNHPGLKVVLSLPAESAAVLNGAKRRNDAGQRSDQRDGVLRAHFRSLPPLPSTRAEGLVDALAAAG